jgi:hypothetical protein
MDNTDTDIAAPASPVLKTPREAAVVNGEEVTFAWQSVDDATSYVLQVARTATFDDLVFEEDLGDKTAVTVADLFPTDNRTFFWRVIALNEAGNSGGGSVESFIATTPEKADQHRAGPQVAEEMGPVTELVRAAGEGISAQMLETESRFEKEKEQGVAYEGIASGQIMAITLSILIVVGVAVVIVFVLTTQRASIAQDEAAGAGGSAELQEEEIEAARELERYEMLDEEEGVYRIPIDRAMDIIATEEYQRQQQEPDTAQTP